MSAANTVQSIEAVAGDEEPDVLPDVLAEDDD